MVPIPKQVPRKSSLIKTWKVYLSKLNLDPNVRLGRYVEVAPEWWWLENADTKSHPLMSIWNGMGIKPGIMPFVKNRLSLKEELGWDCSREDIDARRAIKGRPVKLWNLKQAEIDNRQHDKLKKCIYNDMLLRHDRYWDGK